MKKVQNKVRIRALCEENVLHLSRGKQKRHSKTTTMSKTKVVHLRMDGKNYFFGSVKAMFDTMGKAKLGMTYRSFHSNVKLQEDVTYINRRRGYEITMSYLIQAKSGRGLQGSARAAHVLKMQREAGLMPDPATFMTEEGMRHARVASDEHLTGKKK